VVAYLGVPLLTLAGEPIGILCAIDFVPRRWSESEIRVVEDLAATVMAYIEARPAPRDTSLPGGLNIAAVSQRTGVAADTLRKWERRYGVLRPRRTPGGQRRYDELDVARVEWLRDRLAEGLRIGAAAALLAPANGDAASTAHTTDELRDALVAAARAGDPARLSGLVDQALALYPFATVIEEIVTPALAGVGDGWRGDSGAIGDEHLLSEIVRARLDRMLSDRRAGVRGKVVLACAPGERHELGLLALAVLLQADGWLIAYLGADAPVESALALGRRLEADVVCVSVTMPDALERLAAELEAAPAGGPVVVAGGPAVSDATELPARVLGGSLTAVVEQLRAA
jgi:DNA-binding transcriptional MerR regulator